MLTALLLVLIVAFASGAPASGEPECRKLRQVIDSVMEWKKSGVDMLLYVEHLKEQHQHEVVCKNETLCKAKVILEKKLIEKVLNGTHVDITIRALDVYIGHQNDCHNMTLQNPAEEKKLTHFLDDVKKCAQQLFRSCSTRP